MNIKITEDSVIFKITEEEMQVLLTGQALEKKRRIGTSDFVMQIDPKAGESVADPEDIALKLILDKRESCLMLCTTTEKIKRLFDMGKSREGLSSHTGGLDVYLQVDLRTDKRPPNLMLTKDSL